MSGVVEDGKRWGDRKGVGREEDNGRREEKKSRVVKDGKMWRQERGWEEKKKMGVDNRRKVE
jgi:hypothetical protein